MPILDPLKLDVVPCTCGRLSNKIHCAHCGSYDVRGSVKEIERVDKATGALTKYHVYRCRHCGLSFDGYDWRFDCRAPYYETRSMRLKHSLENQNPKEITQEIKGLKGLVNNGKLLDDAQMQMLIAHAKEQKRKELEQKELAQRAEENKNGQ